jgi:hypothetical protein
MRVVSACLVLLVISCGWGGNDLGSDAAGLGSDADTQAAESFLVVDGVRVVFVRMQASTVQSQLGIVAGTSMDDGCDVGDESCYVLFLYFDDAPGSVNCTDGGQAQLTLNWGGDRVLGPFGGRPCSFDVGGTAEAIVVENIQAELVEPQDPTQVVRVTDGVVVVAAPE